MSVAMIRPYSSRKTFSSVACGFNLCVSVLLWLYSYNTTETQRHRGYLGSCFCLHLDEWPHFDRARSRRGNPRGDARRFVEVPGFNQKIAAELLVRLGEWAIGNQLLAIAHAHAGRSRD